MKVKSYKSDITTISGLKLADSNSDLLELVGETMKKSKEIISLHRQVIHQSVSCRKESYRNRMKMFTTQNNSEEFEPTEVPHAHQNAEKTAQQMLIHDIRSPMGRISGLVQLIKDHETLPEELKQIIQLVEEQSIRALELTQLHNVYQQLEIGSYQPINVPFDLLQLIRKIQHNFKQLQHSKSIEVFVNGHTTEVIKSCIINSDAQVMELMLQNLLQNAVEASPSDGVVRVDISQHYQTIGFNPSQAHSVPITIISIHNQGVIPKIIQDCFFDKYITFGKTKGTGLGTYIAMLVAKSYHGNITFQSTQERGTTLKVQLPGKILI